MINQTQTLAEISSMPRKPPLAIDVAKAAHALSESLTGQAAEGSQVTLTAEDAANLAFVMRHLADGWSDEWR